MLPSGEDNISHQPSNRRRSMAHVHRSTTLERCDTIRAGGLSPRKVDITAPTPPDNRGRSGRGKSSIQWMTRQQMDDHNFDCMRPKKLVAAKYVSMEGDLTPKPTEMIPQSISHSIAGHADNECESPPRTPLSTQVYNTFRDGKSHDVHDLAAEMAGLAEATQVQRRQNAFECRNSWIQQMHEKEDERHRQLAFRKSWPYGPQAHSIQAWK